MKILLDAQLPRSLVLILQAEGCNAVHTIDLPQGNHSTDSSISARADDQGRVVFSKDADFIQSLLLQGSPRKLLVVDPLAPITKRSIPKPRPDRVESISIDHPSLKV